jgi:hypothetical protein
MYCKIKYRKENQQIIILTKKVRTKSHKKVQDSAQKNAKLYRANQMQDSAIHCRPMKLDVSAFL